MEDTAKRDRFINVIKQLLNRSTEKGCSEAEALSAIIKARKLMDRYQISETELSGDLVKETMISRIEHNKKKCEAHTSKLFMTVGSFVNCLSYQDKDIYSKITFCYYGNVQDTRFGVALFNTLSRIVEDSLSRYKETSEYKMNENSGQVKCRAFRAGMIARLCEKLNAIKEITDKIKEEEAKTAGIVLYSTTKSEMFESIDKDFGVQLRQVTSKSRVRGDAKSKTAGKNAGSKVNFGKNLR